MPYGVCLVRRFLAEGLSGVGSVVTLSEEVSHHVLRVTGIAPGETVELFDGVGAACHAVLLGSENGLARLKVVNSVAQEASGTRVDLVVAQTRANTMDTVLRMVTELGVQSIQVVHTERCVARGDKRDRWRRIVESAAAQCGQNHVPEVRAPLPLSDVLSSVEGVRLVCAPGSPVGSFPGDRVTILVGPEGGLSESELADAERCGWTRVGLAETVLRADTAAVAAVVRYG